MQFAGQGGRQIEPEAVHMHLQDPVAQGIHDELQHMGIGHVEAVAGASVVHVVAAVILHQPVVIGVVDPFEAQDRPEFIAFCSVVVDHVKNDFDACLVEGFDHLFEFRDRSARTLVAHITWVRREERNGVVAPVVAKSLVDQVLVLQ